jgi:hypothetical protein
MNSIAFWWAALGSARGIWPSELAPPAELQDLWADVSVVLDRMRDLIEEPGLDTATVRLEPGLAALGDFERVGMWGLCA